jgi:prepilin-type N-terminal cleavage/methylation domain-containing protein
MGTKKAQRGFSLLELLVASAIGLVVMAAMTSLFKTGMDATFTVSQRAETQQNMRAAIEMMTKDIGLAGSGIPSGGLQLASGGTVSLFGCNQGGTCYVPGGTYPASASGAPNFMYPIEPNFTNGVQGNAAIPAAGGLTNSSITVVYCDYNFSLSNFTFASNFPATPSVTVNVVPVPTVGLPTNIQAAGGLQTGDLLLFVINTPGNGKTATGTSLVQNAAVVGEITGIAGNAVPPAQTAGAAIAFSPGDALNFNQNGAGITNNMASVAAAANAPGAQLNACRLKVVSYFLQVPVAGGGLVQTPRLMRQENGLNAIPVADNIINLQFTYDVINAVTGTVVANQQSPPAGSQALIQKVNVVVMGQGLTTTGNKAQSMYLATSVSTRDMSFCNSYSSSNTQCQ